jgi:hypothetical protein
MTAYLLLNHLLNFMAPAGCMALLVVGLSRLLPMARAPGGAHRGRWRRHLGIVFSVNLLVLAAGLVFFRNDGKLLTYAAVALASAVTQWTLLRGWKA